MIKGLGLYNSSETALLLDRKKLDNKKALTYCTCFKIGVRVIIEGCGVVSGSRSGSRRSGLRWGERLDVLDPLRAHLVAADSLPAQQHLHAARLPNMYAPSTQMTVGTRDTARWRMDNVGELWRVSNSGTTISKDTRCCSPASTTPAVQFEQRTPRTALIKVLDGLGRCYQFPSFISQAPYTSAVGTVDAPACRDQHGGGVATSQDERHTMATADKSQWADVRYLRYYLVDHRKQDGRMPWRYNRVCWGPRR